MLLLDTRNESYENSTKFERNALSNTKKLFKKNRKKNTTVKANAPISQTASEYLNVTSQTYRMRNKEVKMKLGQLQDEISKVSLPVSTDLTNEFKSVILETDYRKMSPFIRLFWELQQKYLQSSQNNYRYHPMNPDTDVTYQIVNLFSSDKGFIYFILWNYISAIFYEDRECCLYILPKRLNEHIKLIP